MISLSQTILCWPQKFSIPFARQDAGAPFGDAKSYALVAHNRLCFFKHRVQMRPAFSSTNP